MAKHTYVIENNDGHLWDGALWTNEYPDAMLFNSKPESRKMANHLSAVLDEPVLIIKDYGMDTEDTTKIVCY